MQLVRKYDGEFPSLYFDVFLEYANIEKEYFHKVIDSWRSDHLWEKIAGEWNLKHKV